MKRHKSLYPLSHDHHHALVQAKILRTAANSSDQESLYRTAIQAIEFWDGDLLFHFRQEEAILLPILSHYTATDHSVIAETLKQHGDIQAAVNQLKKNVSQKADLTRDSQVLANLISQHIRYEEQILFPLVQEAVPEEALWEINHRLTEKE